MISFACLASFSIRAQTQLKINAAFWLFGITNVSVETALSDKLTANAETVYSPWKSINGNHFQMFQIMPEVRFYPKDAFEKFYVGGVCCIPLFRYYKVELHK